MRSTLVLWTLLGLAVAGCSDRSTSRESAAEPAHDADPAESVVVDFGDPEQHPLLLDGWSQPERSEDGESWVWAVDLRAAVEIELPHPHFRTLSLRCWPFGHDEENPQTIRLAVNDRPLRLLELRPGHHTYTIAVPEAALRRGRNVLSFDFRHARSPRDLDPAAADRRTLAVAFDFLRLEEEERPLYPPGDPSLFFAGQALETFRVELGRETRSALAAVPGRSLKRKLDVRRGTGLEIAATQVCPPGSRCRGSRTFRVEVQHGWLRREVLWERTVPSRLDSPGWQTAHIDLDRFAGKSLELELAVSAEGEAQTADESVSFWGEPLLIEPAGRPRFNVLLISIDTLRADRLGCYGHSRDTSPALDALARDGVHFRRAVSQAPWTTPSHMSLLTSLYPSAHRVNQGWSEALGFMLGASSYRILSPEIDTLARILRRHGYRTYAHTGGATLAAEFGFAQGFDVYLENADVGFDRLTPEVWEALRERLAGHRDAPFFLFFHTFGPHAPYASLRFAGPLLTDAQRRDLEELFASAPPEPIKALRRFLVAHGLFRREIVSALYDGSIRATDDFLARLFDELRGLGLWDRTLVVVTSDHGEELGDHAAKRIYDAHCHTMYEELLQVPLVLHLPGRFEPGTVVEPAVELIDVAPTILDLVGLPVPEAMQGRSLRRLAAGDPGAAKPWILSEATCIEPEMKALSTGDYKLITALKTAGGERTGLAGEVEWELLFDLRQDPREKHSLHESEPELLELLRRGLAERFASMPEAGGGEATTRVSEEVLEGLRALGYVD